MTSNLGFFHETTTVILALHNKHKKETFCTAKLGWSLGVGVAYLAVQSKSFNVIPLGTSIWDQIKNIMAIPKGFLLSNLQKMGPLKSD